MLLAVLSDTHRDEAALRRALPLCKNADAVAHLGDMTSDASRFERMLGKHVIKVSGNNDYGPEAPQEATLTLGAARVWLTHGHRYGVKHDLLRLGFAAEEREADIVLFGHTHTATVERRGLMLLVNPGAAGGWRPTLALIEITPDDIVPRIVNL